jgi:hypothetical protein
VVFCFSNAEVFAKRFGGERRLLTPAQGSAAKAVWLGEVEAHDEAAAIEKGAAEFKVAATRLMTIRR